MIAPPEVGLLLLTGGKGERLGGPKHDRSHPLGGSWGGHLVRVFEAVFPGGPVELLGEPLPDRPDLRPMDDPRLGPAEALKAWAAQGRGEHARRWWVVACDLPRWTEADLRAWWSQVLVADPEGAVWVVPKWRGTCSPWVASCRRACSRPFQGWRPRASGAFGRPYLDGRLQRKGTPGWMWMTRRPSLDFFGTRFDPRGALKSKGTRMISWFGCDRSKRQSDPNHEGQAR